MVIEPPCGVLASVRRMNNGEPLPDLNLMPDCQVTDTGISAGDTGLTELQLAPQVEEVNAEPQTQKPSESIPIHGVLSDSDVTPPPQPLSSSASTDVYAESSRVADSVRSSSVEQQPEAYGTVSEIGSHSRANVPVPEEETEPLLPPGFEDVHVSSRPPPMRSQRPKELARFTNICHEHLKQLRETVKRTRRIYASLLIHEQRTQNNPRSYMNACSLMRDRGLWLNQEKHFIGNIPGLEIGDMFFYRTELCLVGLHGHSQSGICFLPKQRSNEDPIATSIIVSGGYEDDEDTGNVLIYTGQGGQDTVNRTQKQSKNQKLDNANLAMKMSMHYGVEIRVIRGFKYQNNVSYRSTVYVYDGLYKIVDAWYATGRSGFDVFKFKLVRLEGQPEMGSEIMRLAQTLKHNPSMVRPTGYISFDLSSEKESVPVHLYNDVDCDREPLKYSYIAKSLFSPEISEVNGTGGCDCSNSCNEDCNCLIKNGGQFAYDHKGNLVRGKPVVFECGRFCKCDPSCENRVTQNGLKNTLEVFKSNETGWGVRTLDIIQAGAFICEYAGVVVTRREAEVMSMNGDGTVIYPGRFAEKWREWGDLSQVYPDIVRPDDPTLPPLDFAMDVSKKRNVAYYIRQSKDPNVMVQFVVYDQNNLMFPRVMLFALDNISPLAELSLDYGSAKEVKGKLSISN